MGATRYAVGFDIGGTKIEAAVVSDRGEVLRSLRVATPKDDAGTRAAILQVFDRLKGPEEMAGIGFGIPGSIDPQTGILRNAPNSPALNGTRFFAELKSHFSLPVRVENDANCLALGEAVFGAAKGYNPVVGIIMGTGVGSGFILDGEVYRGSRGLAPELGHIPLDVNGRDCLCGNKGCAEAYLSGPSILKRYRERGGSPEVKTAGSLFARPDDAAAKAVVRETLDLFARFMAAIVSIYDPQIIVLGGGMTRQKAYYEMTEAVSRHVFGSRAAPPIRPAQYGDASGKVGAAALALRRPGARY